MIVFYLSCSKPPADVPLRKRQGTRWQQVVRGTQTSFLKALSRFLSNPKRKNVKLHPSPQTISQNRKNLHIDKKTLSGADGKVLNVVSRNWCEIAECRWVVWKITLICWLFHKQLKLLAILCRERHKLALMRQQKLHSQISVVRFLEQKERSRNGD